MISARRRRDPTPDVSVQSDSSLDQEHNTALHVQPILAQHPTHSTPPQETLSDFPPCAMPGLSPSEPSSLSSPSPVGASPPVTPLHTHTTRALLSEIPNPTEYPQARRDSVASAADRVAMGCNAVVKELKQASGRKTHSKRTLDHRRRRATSGIHQHSPASSVGSDTALDKQVGAGESETSAPEGSRLTCLQPPSDDAKIDLEVRLQSPPDDAKADIEARLERIRARRRSTIESLWDNNGEYADIEESSSDDESTIRGGELADKVFAQCQDANVAETSTQVTRDTGLDSAKQVSPDGHARRASDPLAPPKPLFRVPVAEEEAVPEAQNGLGRILQPPLHDHTILASQEDVPWYECKPCLKDIVIKAREARALCEVSWAPRLVFNYCIGSPKATVTKWEAPTHQSVQGSRTQLATPPLRFESRFESGNLARAMQVGEYGYELSMQNDVNSRGHTQWFYFSCSDVVPGVEYTFWINNFYKKSSLYNDGMMPLGYSINDPERGWHRCASDICYYKSTQRRSDDKGFLYCLSFKYTFEHPDDTFYFANCFPYTYTNLQRHLRQLQEDPERNATFRRKKLCDTLAGNAVDLITVTNPVNKPDEMKNRRKVVISARVHPGLLT